MKKLLLAFVAVILLAGAGGGYVYWRAAQGLAPAALEAKYMTPSDRFVEVAGARVRVREDGPAGAPPIVLMHGYIYSLETWDAWAEKLAKDYRVIRFDLLGHGLTGPDPQRRYSPAERAAFVGDVMDALGLERAVIGGNSLGGLAAWRFAAARPDRVTALILIAPGAYPVNGIGDEPVPAPKPFELFLRTAPASGVKATLERIFVDDAKATPARITLMRDMMRRKGNGEAFVQAIDEFTLPDPEPELAKITAPTLILWGAQDMVLPVEHGSRIAAVIPNARLIVYDDAGHTPQEETPAASAADVAAFLASLKATSQADDE